MMPMNGSLELERVCLAVVKALDPPGTLRGAVFESIERRDFPPVMLNEEAAKRIRRNDLPVNIVRLVPAKEELRAASPTVEEFGAPEDLYWRCAMCYCMPFVCCNSFTRMLKLLPSCGVSKLTYQGREMPFENFGVLSVRFVPREVYVVVSEPRDEMRLVERSWGADDVVYRMMPCYAPAEDSPEEMIVLDISSARFGLRGPSGGIVCIEAQSAYIQRLGSIASTIPELRVISPQCLTSGEIALEGAAVASDLLVEKVALDALAALVRAPPIPVALRAGFRTTVACGALSRLPLKTVRHSGNDTVELEALCQRIIEAWTRTEIVHDVILASYTRDTELPRGTVGVTAAQIEKLGIPVHVIRTRAGLRRRRGVPFKPEAFRANADDLFWRTVMVGAETLCCNVFMRVLQTLPARRITHGGRELKVEHLKVLEQEYIPEDVHVIVSDDGEAVAAESLVAPHGIVKRHLMCYDADPPFIIDLAGSGYGIRGLTGSVVCIESPDIYKLLIPHSSKAKNYVIGTVVGCKPLEAPSSGHNMAGGTVIQMVESMTRMVYAGLGLGPPPTRPACFRCHQPLEKRLSCSRCDTAVYCGPECQGDDWPLHKTMCKAMHKKSRRRSAA
eukprot:Polyplicarium_translucidae@DN1967_c0_g1_i1.p1